MPAGVLLSALTLTVSGCTLRRTAFKNPFLYPRFAADKTAIVEWGKVRVMLLSLVVGASVRWG